MNIISAFMGIGIVSTVMLTLLLIYVLIIDTNEPCSIRIMELQKRIETLEAQYLLKLYEKKEKSEKKQPTR